MRILKSFFSSIFKKLKEKEAQIIQGFQDSEGKSVDIGGYYRPDAQKVQKALRPVTVFNQIIDED